MEPPVAMRLFTLQRQQVVPASLEETFEFLSDPRNLAQLTPPWTNLELVGSSDPHVSVGTELRFRWVVCGVPLRWTARIVSWLPGRQFVDEQVRGPFRVWTHVHTFEPVYGGTKVTDRVRYAPRGGEFANRYLVRRVLERVFDHRARATEEALGRGVSAAAIRDRDRDRGRGRAVARPMR